MNIVDELTKVAPDTQGPDDAVVATERAAFLKTMTKRRRFPRRRTIFGIATAVALVGTGAAAASVIRKPEPLPTHGIFQGAEVKVGVGLSATKRVELLAARNPAQLGKSYAGLDCPTLRVASTNTATSKPVLCALVRGESNAVSGLSVATERVADGTYAIYGRTPDGATEVEARFEDATTRATPPTKGWYLLLAPARPAHVVAHNGSTVIAELAPTPESFERAISGGDACVQQKGLLPERPNKLHTPQEAYVSVHHPNAHLLAQGWPKPGLWWITHVEKRRGKPYLGITTFGADGQPQGGSTATPDKLPLSASASSLDDQTDAIVGAVTAKATSVVVTDSLGRTCSTSIAVTANGRTKTLPQLVSDSLFPDRKFWTVVISSATPVAKIEAFDLTGKRLGLFRFEI